MFEVALPVGVTLYAKKCGQRAFHNLKKSDPNLVFLRSLIEF